LHLLVDCGAAVKLQTSKARGLLTLTTRYSYAVSLKSRKLQPPTQLHVAASAHVVSEYNAIVHHQRMPRY